MLYSSLDELLKLYKTTSPQKLFDYEHEQTISTFNIAVNFHQRCYECAHLKYTFKLSQIFN